MASHPEQWTNDPALLTLKVGNGELCPRTECHSYEVTMTNDREGRYYRNDAFRCRSCSEEWEVTAVGVVAPVMYSHQVKTVAHYYGHPRALDTSDPGCVDAATEFLTPTGWKRFDTYQPGDLVAQFDPDTGTAEFVEPQAYIKRPCDEMIHFTTQRGVDQMLSPEHRMLVYKENGRHEVLSASEVVLRHTASQQGIHRFLKTTFLLDQPGSPLNDAELRVQVAVMADGHIHRGCPNRCAINIKRERKKIRITQLLADANINYKRSDLAGGYSRFYFPSPRKTKTPTAELWGLSSAQREVVIDECAYWDGSRRKAGAVDFYSRDKASADWIQFCAVTTGRTSTLLTCTQENGTDYVVHIRAGEKQVGLKGGSGKARTDYVPTLDGFKYCFAIPTSFFIARRNGRVFATGNTGKTRSVLEAIKVKRDQGATSPVVVLSTLSTMEKAWVDDCKKYTPELTCQVVTASKRVKQLPPETNADIYIVNHDGVKWLEVDGQELIQAADTLVIDEFTQFKHRTSARSKAAARIRHGFDTRWILSGTPNSNGICDIWHPVFLVDDGVRLGKAFWGFRAQVCTPVPNPAVPGGNHIDWVDKEDAELIVADRMHDITVRHIFEECVDIPPNRERTLTIDLPPKLLRQYRELEREAALMLENGEAINAIHAGVKANKLLQLCSGAVYDQEGSYVELDSSRTKLAMDLAEERSHCLIAFTWKHQRDRLIREAEARGISYAVIDGETKYTDRNLIVDAFQAGKIRVIFAHPKSAGHGLTLTMGVATIWPSPTSDAEWFTQFNKRIYRSGQTSETETILIAANYTREEQVYMKLGGKLERMGNLLQVFAQSTALAT